MKAHISAAERKAHFTKVFEENLTKVRLAGLAAGSKAVSAVVYKKATEPGKTAEERLEDVISFCKTGLDIKPEEVAGITK